MPEDFRARTFMETTYVVIRMPLNPFNIDGIKIAGTPGSLTYTLKNFHYLTEEDVAFSYIEIWKPDPIIMVDLRDVLTEAKIEVWDQAVINLREVIDEKVDEYFKAFPIAYENGIAVLRDLHLKIQRNTRWHDPDCCHNYIRADMMAYVERIFELEKDNIQDWQQYIIEQKTYRIYGLAQQEGKVSELLKY